MTPSTLPYVPCPHVRAYPCFAPSQLWSAPPLRTCHRWVCGKGSGAWPRAVTIGEQELRRPKGLCYRKLWELTVILTGYRLPHCRCVVQHWFAVGG